MGTASARSDGLAERDDMKKISVGWFVYESRDDGWADRFVIEDDDGMPFALDDFKQFHGRPVQITIEDAPTLKADTSQTAYVYERAGLTAEKVRQQRDDERREMLKAKP